MKLFGLIAAFALAGCVTAPGYNEAARAAVENCSAKLPPGALAT